MHTRTVRSKNPAETFGAPAQPDAGQRGMIGQSFMQAITHEPTDRDVDFRFAHQPPVMDDPQQKSSQHQSYRHFRIDPGSAIVTAIKIGDFVTQPGKVKNAINPHQHIVVRNKLAQ